jgi:heterodisulfide reductase subunit A-like polyferredoxin
MPGDYFPAADGRIAVGYFDNEQRTVVRENFDLVVLSVGIMPRPENQALYEMLGLTVNEHGFAAAPRPERPRGWWWPAPRKGPWILPNPSPTPPGPRPSWPVIWGCAMSAPNLPEERLHFEEISVCRKVLVVGHGWTALHTARELADLGLEVLLVTAQSELGDKRDAAGYTAETAERLDQLLAVGI